MNICSGAPEFLVTPLREAEKKNQFSFACIFFNT